MGVLMCSHDLKDSRVSCSTACASMNRLELNQCHTVKVAHVLCVFCSLMDFPCCEAAPLSDRGVLKRMQLLHC